MNEITKHENSEITVLGGIISVTAAIESGKRDIYRVFVDAGKFKKRDRKITRFVSMLKANKVPFELCEREAIDAFIADNDPSGGTTHGGVAASVGPRRYENLKTLLDKAVRENGYLIFLDGVEDPFNLGYACRSLYAFGCSGIILPGRSWESASGVCARASAGASEHIDIAFAGDLSSESLRMEFLRELKKRGITLACAAVSSESEGADAYDYPAPLIIIIGGEKRGISPEFVENADAILHIPYANPKAKYSLTTADCAAVFGLLASTKTFGG